MNGHEIHSGMKHRQSDLMHVLRRSVEPTVYGDSIVTVLIANEDHRPSERQQGQHSHRCQRTPGTGIAHYRF
jgi:hypothetical protein